MTTPPLLRRCLASLATALVLGVPSPTGAQTPPPYDLLVTGGTVVDGTGAPRYRADVALRGDRIVRIARGATIAADSAARVLDAEGLVVAPGFIDNHAHIQTSIDDRPLLENFIRQGITTLMASEHSQDQPYPLAAYMDSIRMAPNVGFFAGHSWIRRRVLGLDDRAPTPAELEAMKALVAEAMRDGALGLSTGLQYVPAYYADTEEIVELAKVAAAHGGIYTSHMRNEATGLLDSVRELVRIADEARIPAQIQHHKAFGPGQWGWSERSLALVDSARAAGLDVKHDQYPYTAASTGWSVLFPEWALAGGQDSLEARLADPTLRARMRREMREEWRMVWTGDDLSRIQFRTVPSLPAYDGERLSDLAEDRGMANDVESGITLVMELATRGGFSAIYHAMDDADVRRIMRHPWGMFETDGDPLGYGQGFPHPRSYGAFPRILGHYVREEGVLSLEEAVRKMTSLPADHIGQHERGRVAEGAYADLTVFDPARVRDRATFTDPHQYPVGIIHVVVNGVPVIRDASLTGEKPGRVIRGPARAHRDGAGSRSTPSTRSNICVAACVAPTAVADLPRRGSDRTWRRPGSTPAHSRPPAAASSTRRRARPPSSARRRPAKGRARAARTGSPWPRWRR
ncbi:MAG: D-aminoacylase [Gemmatimonadetes bacterium]|nr:D-aminoacylase [Gemmatimonadota bacterium]